MAKRYFVKPEHLRGAPKQYTLGENRKLLALHLASGTEEIDVPGNAQNPPSKRTAYAPSQTDLAFLHGNNHPFIGVEEAIEKQDPSQGKKE